MKVRENPGGCELSYAMLVSWRAMTIHSMTGYAEARAEARDMRLRLRIKTFNHRFLDLQLRLAPGLEAQGPEIEKRLRAALRRGHVDLWLEAEEPAADGLDRGRVRAYLAALSELRREIQVLAPGEAGNIYEWLRLPGVLSAAGSQPEESAVTAAVAAALEEALRRLEDFRRGEGAALAGDLLARIQNLRAAVAEISRCQPEIVSALHERLRRRLADLLADAIPSERLAQEAALLAERADISEELTRLEAHLDRFQARLAAGGEVGKPLEFLLQELQRETNTLLAKTSSASPPALRLTEIGLGMKAELEKLREQVQNLE